MVFFLSESQGAASEPSCDRKLFHRLDTRASSLVCAAHTHSSEDVHQSSVCPHILVFLEFLLKNNKKKQNESDVISISHTGIFCPEAMINSPLAARLWSWLLVTGVWSSCSVTSPAIVLRCIFSGVGDVVCGTEEVPALLDTSPQKYSSWQTTFFCLSERQCWLQK